MSKFIELPVFPNDLPGKGDKYMYMPVNIEQIAYIMPLPQDKCKLYLSSGESIVIDIDIEEIKEEINCTRKVNSADDID